MSRRGRYGKYGEIKRLERLRQVKIEAVNPKSVSPANRGQGAPHRRKSLNRQRIVIRPSRPQDLGYIERLSKHVFHPYGPYEAVLANWFQSDMALTCVALRGKKPIGFAMQSLPADLFNLPPVSELLAIAVEPSEQGHGVGRLLMAAVDKRAKALGVEKMVLYTAVENWVGQGLFTQFGFMPIETVPRFYPKGQDALMMVKDMG